MSRKINKEIFQLAIPNILSNISVPLLSTVDTILMGQFSELHIGAVGVGAMIFNFIYWNFGFLRMGTTGITAQAFGSSSDVDTIMTLARALLVAFAIAGLTLIFQVPFGDISFGLMNVSDTQLTLVKEYFFIRIWAAPATFALYALMGWFFGMQNAIYPLVLTLFINVVNIIFSFVFIRYYNFEITGVAYGTVIAQYAGLILALLLFVLKYKSFISVFKTKALFEIDLLKKFLIINRDIFIRTVCLTFAFGFFYSQSAEIGEMTLAANVILLQFLNWMSYGIDGFAYASESLVGKYKGARDALNLNKVIKSSFIWGGALAILFSLCFFIFGVDILYIFTNKVEVVNHASNYLFWIILLPIFSFPCYIWDGIYIGLTASKAMRDSMIISIVVYLCFYYFSENLLLENNRLWFSLLLFLFFRGVCQWVFYKRIKLLV